MLNNNSKLIGIGFSNMVNLDHVIAILSPTSSGGKRLINVARESSLLIDATAGRKTRSVIVLDNKMVIISGLNPATIMSRVKDEEDKE